MAKRDGRWPRAGQRERRLSALSELVALERVAELGPPTEMPNLAVGCSNQEISTATGLSLGTIKNYVSTILLALDVKSRSHLISLFR